AGIKAACVAAERGHQVVLFERSGVLGGQVQLAQLLPGRSEFGGLITNFTREMELAGVDVRRNTELDRAMIENEAPDAVIIATGASVHRPPIEGGDEAHVVDAWQVLREEVNVGQSVVIADWRADWIGLGLAEKLASAGCRVRLAVNGTMAGQTIEAIVRDRWIGDLQKLGVEVIPYVRLFGVDSENVYLQHLINDEAIICEEVDTLVTALGQESETALETDLRGWTGDVFLAGDCLNPRTAEEAVFEGLKAGFAV
ncbi:MAG: FAD-dependent oxidoreductase, partial [Alphaproteobacteria bacterium]|nr:FAD-dependent oxidoreductase [Alphaproteobacteria bacterium]